MTTQGSITGFPVGDDHDLTFLVPSVPSGDALTSATLIVKVRATDADALAVFAKTITTSSVAGVGQIQDTGSSSGQGVLYYQLLAADTTKLTAMQSYAYGVRVTFSGTRVSTTETGVLMLSPQVVGT